MIRSRPSTRAVLLLVGTAAWGCAPTLPSLREPSPPPASAEATPSELSPPALGAESTPPEDQKPPPPAPEPAVDSPREDGERAQVRQRIVEAARVRLGRRTRLDCSGYVLEAYRQAGLTVDLPPARNRSRALQEAGREVVTPEPGDLAFFHDTYDRNRNGKLDDGITHVALVESVDGSSVTLLHRGRWRVERLHMDLEHPSDRVRNDPVRVRRARDPRQTRYLAGELFASFGALLDGPATQSFQARRAEDTGERHPARRWQSTTARVSRPHPAPSRSTRRRGPSSSRSAACSGSCPPTRRSSSRSSASAVPGAPPSPAP